MLGSVLCSPGCFSLYRCQAVRDVLPTYATGVDHAFDFLTKDMGERISLGNSVSILSSSKDVLSYTYFLLIMASL